MAVLTLSCRGSLSYKNQSIDLQTRFQRVNNNVKDICYLTNIIGNFRGQQKFYYQRSNYQLYNVTYLIKIMLINSWDKLNAIVSYNVHI